ncbi:hypothetical protein Xen7305DRAFT_00001350 [Xenococcus sp. PCC 7305]|nr:hypothetical protein Xen7305DRAFT_00001350 [Xenococcus sp. PCC 7305]
MIITALLYLGGVLVGISFLYTINQILSLEIRYLP